MPHSLLSKHLGPKLGDRLALTPSIIGSPCHQNVELVLRNPSLLDKANSLGGEA